MDPTPKRNLVKERQILIKLDGSHPKENYGLELREKEQKGQVDLDLDLDLRSTLIEGLDLKVVPPPNNNNNNNSHRSMTCRLRRR